MLALVVSCGPPSDDEADESAAEENGSDASSDTDEASDDESQGEDPGCFPPEDNEPIAPCDPFLQDCPEGDKCIPVVLEGDDGPEPRNHCVPIIGDQSAGEPCMHPDGLLAGIDDCDGSSACWDLDEEGVGTCHAFCQGSPDDPVCPGDDLCLLQDQGTVALCVDSCDPLAAEPPCPDGEFCVSVQKGFVCQPDEGLQTQVGESCTRSLPCAEGLACLSSYYEPQIVGERACEGNRCCAQLCLPEDPEPGCAEGSTCEALSFIHPQYEGLGACSLP